MNPNKPNMPAPSVEPDELSYYRLTLLSYLRESHPERAADDAFIRARAELAAEAFSNAVRSGMNYDEAVQQADEVLFQGLHFSRLDTLITVLWNEFADEVPAGRAREVALQLLPECGRVFSGYDRRFRVYPRLRPAVRGTGRCNLNLARRKWHITRRHILGTTSRPSA